MKSKNILNSSNRDTVLVGSLPSDVFDRSLIGGILAILTLAQMSLMSEVLVPELQQSEIQSMKIAYEVVGVSLAVYLLKPFFEWACEYWHTTFGKIIGLITATVILGVVII